MWATRTRCRIPLLLAEWMAAKWCGVVSASSFRCAIPLLAKRGGREVVRGSVGKQFSVCNSPSCEKGWRAKPDGVVSASRTRKRCGSNWHFSVPHNTTPSFCTSYRLCKNPPLLKKGNLHRVLLYFSHKKSCIFGSVGNQNST